MLAPIALVKSRGESVLLLNNVYSPSLPLVVLMLQSVALFAGCGSARPVVVDAPAATRPTGQTLYPALMPWRVVSKDGEFGDMMTDEPRWGYIDREGKVIVGPLLASAGDFHEGVAAVRLDLECVAIGRDGRITEQLSKGVREWKEGKRAECPSDPRFCLIDTDARVIVGPLGPDDGLFDPMSCGVALVSRGGAFDHFGYVDADGRWILPIGAPEAHPFNEGFARVRLHGAKGGRIGSFFLDKVHFMNQRGAMPFDGAFDDAGDFSEGLAPVKVKSKWGYIDKTGKLVIPARFAYAGAFAEGVASIADESDHWGFIDHSGTVVIQPRFAMAGDFSEGLAAATTDDYRHGYIDQSGAWAVPPEYDDGNKFSGGLAVVGQSGRYGYIDHHGTLVVPFDYAEAHALADGMGRVSVYDRKWGFIDAHGKVAIPPQFRSANDFHNRLAFVNLEPEVYAYIDKNGTIVWKSQRFLSGWVKASAGQKHD